MAMETQTEQINLLNVLAQQFVAMNAPLQITTARTPAELEQVYRLRYQVVIEKGWAQPGDFPDGQEIDEYDDEALQVVAWDGNILAATTRLVFPSPLRPLPTEASFAVTFHPVGRVVDIGRMTVAPAYRDSRQHKLLRGMIAQAWLEVSQRGYDEICGTLTANIIRLYESVGFEVSPIAPAQPYWGVDRFPCQFDLSKTAEALKNATLT
ncbi:MAG: GNAT family N-acetyltransferase [Chitinophagaceae bacterium]|nr:GNAT family N-acetyltransferase [Anaerolineae bacterium]